MTDDEKAEREVNAFIRTLKEKHGVDIEDLKKIDFAALNDAVQFHAALSRRGDQAASTALRILVASALGAIGWLLIEGFRHFIYLFKVH